jgi:chromosome segregation ATPase
MAFLSESAGYLLVALLLGILVGWLFWGDQPFEVASATGGEVDEEVVGELSSQIETRDQEIVRLRKRLKRMHADLDARDSHVTAAKGQIEELQSLISQHESDLSLPRPADRGSLAFGAGQSPEAHEAYESTVRRLAELEEELALAQHELASARALSGGNASDSAERLARAEGRSTELERAYDALSEELADTQAQLDVALSQVSSGDQTAEGAAELLRLRQDLAASTAKLGEAQRSVELTQQESTRLSADLDSMGADLDAAHQRLAAVEAELAAVPVAPAVQTPVSGVDSMSDMSSEIQLELTKVQTELARSRQSVSSLRQRLQEVEDENELLAGDLAKAQSDLGSRQSRTSEHQLAVDKLSAELAENETQFSATIDELNRSNAEVQRLKTGVLGLDERARKAEDDRAELQAAFDQNRIENESSLSSLHVELSDARLRADAAYDALQELTQEFVSFRDSTQRQQTTMLALAERIDRARSTLVGRSAPLPPSDEEPPEDDLSRLPNMTAVLIGHLREIGVTSYSEIAAWSPADLARIGSMIGEPGPSLEARGWVGAARNLTIPTSN